MTFSAIDTFGFDTETFLIGPGAVAPRMVCLSVAHMEGNYLVGNGDDEVVDNLRALFELGHLIVGHNAAYDCVVIALSYPELEEMIWAKYAAGEIVCTRLNEQLINLGTHGKLTSIKLPDGSNVTLRYGLDVLEHAYLGLDRSDQKSGPDNWRMNYNLLDGKRADQYPPDAAQYAEDDAQGTLMVYFKQLDRAPAGVLDTAPFQAYADFALFMITERGMAIDPEEVEKVRVKVAEELTPEKLQPLVDAGVLRKGSGPRPHNNAKVLARALEILGKTEAPEDWSLYQTTLEAEGIKFTQPVKPSINKKTLVDLVERLCKEYDIDIKLTDKKQTSTDSEVMDDLEGLDEVIDCYRHRQKLQKIVNTELPRMEWEGELSDIVHFPFKALLETGRTSSSANKLFPSGNGQQLSPIIRPCYVARPGHVLLSTDYGTLELATVGQKMIDIFGHSVHADKINNGVDLHSFLAGRMCYELWPDFRKTCDDAGLSTNDDFYTAFMSMKEHPAFAEYKEKKGKMLGAWKWWRDFSKPVGLGFPGALGPWTFLGFAKKSYGVNIAEIAAKLPDSQFQVTDYLLNICKKQLGIVPAEFTWTGQTKAVALAIKLKDIWLDTFQMRPYYEHINQNHKDPVNPSIGETEDKRSIPGYTYTSDFGMIRRGCSYTACCNGNAMQTPAAEGAKTAVIMVTRACRDASQLSTLFNNVHPVDFIHDELLTEHRESDADQLNYEAEEVSRLMLEAMALITPDIPGLRTEGVFMRKWDKYADPTFDDQNRLIVTEPAAPST